MTDHSRSQMPTAGMRILVGCGAGSAAARPEDDRPDAAEGASAEPSSNAPAAASSPFPMNSSICYSFYRRRRFLGAPTPRLPKKPQARPSASSVGAPTLMDDCYIADRARERC